MNEKKEEKIVDKGVVKAAIRLTAVIVIAVVVVIVAVLWKQEKEPEITSSFINNKIEAAGELTSAKIIYNGLVRYSDGEIPFLTKKAFTMIYRAQVSAGIDTEKVTASVTDSKVTVRLPEVEILDIHVDADSIQYYDEKFALFNGEKREDAIQAIQKAEKDVRENGDMESLKENARKQTEVLLAGLFEDVVGDRKLAVEWE